MDSAWQGLVKCHRLLPWTPADAPVGQAPLNQQQRHGLKGLCQHRSAQAKDRCGSQIRAPLRTQVGKAECTHPHYPRSSLKFPQSTRLKALA
jgi:hypothetical protein